MNASRMFVGMVAAGVLAAVSVSANASYVDNYETHTVGSDVNGTNGWVGGSTLWESFGAAAPLSVGSLIVGDNGIGTSNDARPDLQNAGYQTSALAIGPFNTGTYVSNTLVYLNGLYRGGIALGDGNFLNGTGNALWIDELHNSAGAITPVLLQTNGTGVGGVVPQAGATNNAVPANTWMDFELEVIFGGTSTLSWAPVDATTGLPTAAYTQLSQINTPAGFSVEYYGLQSNPMGSIVSTQVFDGLPVPEPASLALLGLGGLMMLRRRRRTA